MTFEGTPSGLPFSPSTAAERRYLLVDGATLTEGALWLNRQDPVAAPIPVLADGYYDALSSMGPLLVKLGEDCRLTQLWQERNDQLKTGAIVYLSGTKKMLVQWFRARVQVSLPDGRVVWLRLGDAGILKRLLDNAADVPAQFWTGISGISLAAPDGFVHARSEIAGQPEVPTILAEQIEPRFHFSPPLVTALEQTSLVEHREVL